MPQSLNAPRGSKPRSDAKPVEPSAPAPITPRAVYSAAAGSPTKRRVARTDTSAELDFDEFLEIMVRICNEKLPKPRDGPFEQSLNRWLGATLVPALLAASKARKLTGGV